MIIVALLRKLYAGIEGWHVVIAGYLYAVIAGLLWTSGVPRIVWLLLVAFAALNWYKPFLGIFLDKIGFADKQYWIPFVVLAIGGLVVSHQSYGALGSVFMTYDGMYFDLNY